MSQLVVDSQGCADFEEGHHSFSTASSVSGNHSGSRSSGLLSLHSMSARTESDEIQHIGIRGSPQVEFSRSLEYRILPIIWICYFWDKQLEKAFTQQNISAQNATATEKLKERQNMEWAVLAFYIGRTIGVWFAILALMVEEFSRVIPTSIFLTSVFASLLTFYSEQNSSVRIVCYTLCALWSSSLMPAAILLTFVCYGQLSRPLRCIIWATAGPIAISIAEMNLHIGEKTNAPILIEGVFFGMLSLAIEPWMEKIKPGAAPWSLSQRAVMVFDTENHPNNWTRFRALWKLCKNQVSGSLVDYQLYFFLLFSIADASIKRQLSELLGWKFADAFAQASPLLAYAIVGAILHFSTRVGYVAIPMTVVTFMEMCGWWPLQNCEKLVYGHDGAEKCRPTALWLLSLVPATGEISITLAIVLLLANISGKVRNVFLVAVFCSGYAIGGLMCTVLTSRLTIDQWYKFVLIASTIKIVCLWIYVNFTAVQNLKRRQVAGGESTCAMFEGVSEETEETDIENDHFVYVY